MEMLFYGSTSCFKKKEKLTIPPPIRIDLTLVCEWNSICMTRQTKEANDLASCSMVQR